MLNRALFMAALACACSVSQAQPGTAHVSTTQVEMGGWMLNPIYIEPEAGCTAHVQSFLALADVWAVSGDNIVAVWYVRGSNGMWTTKSWSTSDVWGAIKSVKSDMGISDSEDGLWSVEVPDSGTLASEQKDYMAGVLADDALVTLITDSPDRDFIVTSLVAIGYKAADLAIDKSDCSVDSKLEGMAAAVEQTLTGDEETMTDRSMMALAASSAASCLVAGVQITPFPIKPTTPWAPPVYSCSTWWDPLGSGCWSTCCVWTETRTVTQKRTRAQMNPTPPPTYQYCDQTNTGIETRTTQCCVSGCITLITPTFVPCPTVAPGTTPAIGSVCPPGSTTTTSSTYVWAGWIPACPF
jgi:hypothetical protein